MLLGFLNKQFCNFYNKGETFLKHLLTYNSTKGPTTRIRKHFNEIQNEKSFISFYASILRDFSQDHLDNFKNRKQIVRRKK